MNLKSLIPMWCIWLCLGLGSALAGDGFPGREKILDSMLLAPSAKDLTDREVIVTLKEPAGTKSLSFNGDKNLMDRVQAEAAELQDRVISRMKAQKSLGFAPGLRLKNYPVFSARVDSKALRTLAGLDEVAAIEADEEMQLDTVQGISGMHPQEFRSTYGGEGLAVAIVDTGVNYRHPALGGGPFPNDKTIGGVDVGDRDADPMDTNGHGSACAGIAAGLDTHADDFMGGVAPEAKIYALKVENRNKIITGSSLLAAWDWCLTHQFDHPRTPIMIISMSITRFNRPSEDFCQKDPEGGAYGRVAQQLEANGIAIFVSSGNNGFRSAINFTACLKQTFSVGAVFDADIGPVGFSCCKEESTGADLVTCYSNSSRILDLLAPAHCATAPAASGNGYKKCFGGTSAACPYAAGAAALIQSAAKAKTGRFLSVAELRDLMTRTGVPIRDPKSDITTPRVDIGKAIESLGAAPPAEGGASGKRKISGDKLRKLFQKD